MLLYSTTSGARESSYDRQAASILGRAFDQRQDADYDPDDPPPVETTRKLIDDVEAFIEAVSRMLKAPER